MKDVGDEHNHTIQIKTKFKEDQGSPKISKTFKKSRKEYARLSLDRFYMSDNNNTEQVAQTKRSVEKKSPSPRKQDPNVPHIYDSYSNLDSSIPTIPIEQEKVVFEDLNTPKTKGEIPENEGDLKSPHKSDMLSPKTGKFQKSPKIPYMAEGSKLSSSFSSVSLGDHKVFRNELNLKWTESDKKIRNTS